MRSRKPSPTLVIAVLALFIALGGSAVAAKHYLVTSTRQIKPSVLRTLKGKVGPQGPSGAPGTQGPAGSPGLLALTTVNGASFSYRSGEFGPPPTAECPAGSTVVGTGFKGPFGATTGGFVMKFGTFVGGFFINETASTVAGNVQAICAQLPPGASASSVNTAWRHSHERDVAAFRSAVASAVRQAVAARAAKRAK